jgi:fluoride exporter
VFESQPGDHILSLCAQAPAHTVSAMSTILTYLLIGTGSALGGMLRYLLSTLIDHHERSSFPWGILTVNLIGCLAMGIAFGSVEKTQLKFFLMTGILGGFTTFSAFSLITLELAQRGRWDLAAAYIAASVLGCLAAVWLGFIITATLKGVPVQ